MGLFDFLKKKKPASPLGEIKVTVNVSTPQRPSQEEVDAQIIPVEARIKKAIASKHGLFPHEILVLDYAHTFYTYDNSFQGFWWYRYGIRDVQAVLSSLEQHGFLQAGDLHSALQKQTVATLKELLKAHGLKQSGKKDELIQRAMDAISADKLNRQFPQRTYQLTESGKAALEEESYVPYIHRHGIEDLDIWSLNQLVHTPPYMSYRDKIWGYLNQRSMKHASDRNFGLYRNCRFAMSRFLKEEGKTQDSLAMLAEVVFYDLSGATNNFDIQYLEIFASGFFPYENSLAATAPGIISAIMDCQEKLGYTDEELKAFLVERMDKLTVPLQLFSVEDCAKIVFLERDQDKEALTAIYAKAKKAFKAKYPKIRL